MSSDAIVVLGSDAVALAVAGRLALDGHRVVSWETPLDRGSIVRTGERPQIRLGDASGEAVATLAAATSNPLEALAAGDVLLSFASPHAQSALVDFLLPLVEPRHTLALLPGSLGSLACAKWLRDRGRAALPTLVESDVAPMVCHRLAPDFVHTSAVVADPGFGVFPASRTEAAMATLVPLFPDARAHPHVVAAALAAVFPLLRAPALLMNAGGECRRAGFSLLEDGFSIGVARVAETLDAERLALAVALGLDLPTAAESLHAWGLSPCGDLWAAVNGSRALTHTPDADVSRTGPPADEIAFGLRPWVELAERLDVATPVSRALMDLCAAAAGHRCTTGRSLDDLGIGNMDLEVLHRFLETGSDVPTT